MAESVPRRSVEDVRNELFASGPEQPAEGLDDRTEGQRGVAEIDRPALEHQSAGGTRGSSRLGHEPTLADTGFAREQHERGSTLGGRSERGGQPIELGLAADELRAGEATRHLHAS